MREHLFAVEFEQEHRRLEIETMLEFGMQTPEPPQHRLASPDRGRLSRVQYRIARVAIVHCCEPGMLEHAFHIAFQIEEIYRSMFVRPVLRQTSAPQNTPEQ